MVEPTGFTYGSIQVSNRGSKRAKGRRNEVGIIEVETRD